MADRCCQHTKSLCYKYAQEYCGTVDEVEKLEGGAQERLLGDGLVASLNYPV